MSITELDKARGTAKPGFGGSPFGSISMPSEFTPLVSAHQTVSKLSTSLTPKIASADQEYEKQMDPSTSVPSAPVYAARLNGLLLSLATAESAVAECVKAREGLIAGLEKLLETNRTALQQETEAASRMAKRKTETEEKKQQVELAIMQALGPSEAKGPAEEGGSGSPLSEPDRPEMEALTPPAMDDDTYVPEPKPIEKDDSPEEPVEHTQDASGIEMLSTLASSYQALPVTTNGSNKRRRVDEAEDFPDLGNDDGIDADVAEMLKGDAQA